MAFQAIHSVVITLVMVVCLVTKVAHCINNRPVCLQEDFTTHLEKESERLSQVGIVRPVIHDSQQKRRIRSIGKDQVTHAERLTISLSNSSLIMDLKLNRELLPDNFYVRHHAGGQEDIWRQKESFDHRTLMCHYKGTIRNNSNSWVALSTCYGLSGTVYDGSDVYYIEPLENTVDGNHSWIKHLKNSTQFPLSGSGTSVDQEEPAVKTPSSKTKREVNQKKTYSGALNVEMVFVVDSIIYRRYHGEMHFILKRVLDIANIIHEIYSALQVSIVLVGVVVWSNGDQISITNDASATLSEFGKYRRKYTDKSHDTAHLLTGRPFVGPVGKAYVDVMCRDQEKSCSVVVDNVDAPAAMTASIVAHEMGHNFGMKHDQDHETPCDCQTPDKGCVMTKMISVPTTHWSSCSKTTMQHFLRGDTSACIRNKPTMCGNMVVDPGEECDCGLPGFCQNKCCDPSTCKYSQRTPQVVCANGPCCDLQTCQFQFAGILCRREDQSGCDLPEYCLGHTSTCPSDLYKFNGTKCDSKKVCRNKVCVRDLSIGQKTRLINSCPVNCSNSGMCNNLGKCFCKAGFDPPNCEEAGYGGSEDGGYMWDPSVSRTFQIELYVIFLGIFPILIFLFFCFYYFLDEEQKTYFKILVRTIFVCQKGRFGKTFSGLRPTSLIRSISIDKSTKKRDFSSWVKTKVRLSLPKINISTISQNIPSTPMSDCSTATITSSNLNTPDDVLPTPVKFAPRAAIDVKTVLLTPPIHRLRPAPPPPPSKSGNQLFAATNKALDANDGNVIRNVISKPASLRDPTSSPKPRSNPLFPLPAPKP